MIIGIVGYHPQIAVPVAKILDTQPPGIAK